MYTHTHTHTHTHTIVPTVTARWCKVIFGARDDGDAAAFDQEAALMLMGDV